MSYLKSLLGIELSAVSWREKIVSMLGGLISIIVLTFITERVLSLSGATAVIASMGASAVLLFAVPHGQLSQPWPVLAGHVFSALIGVICARFIRGPELAAAFAVCLSIGMMHHMKCIHPPGGATALTAVLGGNAIHDMGFRFVLFPVLVNCLIMVGVAVLFNIFFGWRRYPAYLSHPATPPPPETPSHEEIITALKSIDSFVDVNEDDLIRISRLLANRQEKSDPSP
ncbi:HPP family protein [Luteolibacter yonseiensis]|uniref:HPP family protein n=1 Tax=Luteolibacter yonseiensis TaxID=1144680 RepID=A0A934R7E3_9BACT|nr:HPP family protein [Luteolibacter yonseiensis]MBK1817318.1 HPP family protein [Luteolibacter yonseiensis]